MRRKNLLKIIISFTLFILLGLNASVYANNIDDFPTWNSIYNTWNGSGVTSGTPSVDTLFTISNTTYIQGICNYHWNNNGKTQGTIGIVNNVTGETIGTWNATMTGGSGRSNVNWFVFPNICLQPGTYKIIDSDNSTWSFNSSSGYKGFTDIRGFIPKVIIENTENGKIIPDVLNPGRGETVTLTVIPDEGYKLKNITGITATKVNDTIYTFLMPSENVTISAEFELIAKTISINELTNGQITTDKSLAAENETVTITVSPDEGYKLKNIIGITATKVNDTTYTFIMPNENITISAEFESIYKEKTITKKEEYTTVLIKGTFSGNPELVITKIEKGNEEYNSFISLIKDDKEIIGSYEISIIGGDYEGKLTLAFTVGEQYEGDKVTIYHKKASGEIEILETTVKDGKAEITVDELSPFMLVEDKKVEDKEIVKKQDETPKTGVGDNSYIYTIFIILAIIGIFSTNKLEKNAM